MAVDFRYTRVFNETMDAWLEGKRRVLHQGGTSSSKTFSVLQFLKEVAEQAKEPLLITVVSESLPHLKLGAIADFFNILGESPVKTNPNWRMTDFTYQRPDWKGKVQFFGADDAGKASGPRRQVLFINEGNNVPWVTARALDVRTDMFTIVDWNPTGEFWVHEYLSGSDVIPGWIHDTENNAYVHSTYLDAVDVLPQSVIDRIEANKNDPNWWRVFGEGLTGKLEELVHPNYEIVDQLPEGYYFYGLDFGFTNDPSVLTKNCIIGGDLYSQEIFYKVGMTNNAIAQRMDLAKVSKFTDEIWADSAEPKSIQEIAEKGFNIVGADKKPGSVEYGIQKVNQYRHFWTKGSVNCMKEQDNYRYIKKTTDGGREYISDDTTHFFSHGMDSLIAGTLIETKRGEKKIEDVTTDDYVLTRAGWKRVLFGGKTSSSKEIFTITFSNGKAITGTADHLIWLKDKGFTPLNTCRYSDIIEVCAGKRLSIMGRNIIATLKLLIGRTGCTSGLNQKQSGICIAKYGLTITEPFLKVVRYITKTITRLTMNYLTLNACLVDGISSITQPLILSGEGSGYEPISENTSRRLMTGTSRLKEESGTANTEERHIKKDSHWIKSVLNAVSRLRILPANPQRGFVLTTVNRKLAEGRVRITLRKLADGAVALFKRISINLMNVAPVYVLSVSEPHKEKQPVYDITTEDIPEFYANGILVHNSRRYAVMSYVPLYTGLLAPATNY